MFQLRSPCLDVRDVTVALGNDEDGGLRCFRASAGFDGVELSPEAIEHACIEVELRRAVEHACTVVGNGGRLSNIS
jgi:hypothetical protein